MTTERLEAFSDGVIAIIITVMVLELRVPSGAGLDALRPLLPLFFTYILSFIYLGIYWNNHHHLFRATAHIDGRVMWANLHLLFWLSLVPFTTGWMGENHFAPLPTAVYGLVLLMSGMAYVVLQTTIIGLQGPDSMLARAVGRDFKGKISMVLYLLAIGLAFVNQWVSDGIYVITAAMWLAPDPRIEAKLEEESPEDE